MSRIQHIVTVAVFAMLAAATTVNVHAGPYYYAHPEFVDLAKDLNAVSFGGDGPSQINSYIPNPQSNTTIDGTPKVYSIDLGSPQPVGVINFQKYTEGATSYGATAWTIQRSTDNTNWTDVGIAGDDSTINYTRDAGGASARYVRLYATAFARPLGSVFVLKHMQAYGSASSRIEIRDTLNIGGTPSNNATATISGGVIVASNINDMSPDDDTFGLNGSHGLGDTASFAPNGRDITYTLDAGYAVKGIKWHFYNGFGTIKDYTVWASLNGGPETLVDTNTTSVGHLAYVAFDLSGLAANMLRINVTSTSNDGDVFPGEIEVFGSALPEPTGASLILLTLGAGVARRRR